MSSQDIEIKTCSECSYNNRHNKDFVGSSTFKRVGAYPELIQLSKRGANIEAERRSLYYEHTVCVKCFTCTDANVCPCGTLGWIRTALKKDIIDLTSDCE